MKTKKDDENVDKAKERLRQFESARAPQPTDKDLFNGLEELIANLEAEGTPLTTKAAKRLTQFRTKFFIQFGSKEKTNKNPEKK